MLVEVAPIPGGAYGLLEQTVLHTCIMLRDSLACFHQVVLQALAMPHEHVSFSLVRWNVGSLLSQVIVGRVASFMSINYDDWNRCIAINQRICRKFLHGTMISVGDFGPGELAGYWGSQVRSCFYSIGGLAEIPDSGYGF